MRGTLPSSAAAGTYRMCIFVWNEILHTKINVYIRICCICICICIYRNKIFFYVGGGHYLSSRACAHTHIYAYIHICIHTSEATMFCTQRHTHMYTHMRLMTETNLKNLLQSWHHQDLVIIALAHARAHTHTHTLSLSKSLLCLRGRTHTNKDASCGVIATPARVSADDSCSAVAVPSLLPSCCWNACMRVCVCM
jgi:hypothetical protein